MVAPRNSSANTATSAAPRVATVYLCVCLCVFAGCTHHDYGTLRAYTIQGRTTLQGYTTVPPAVQYLNDSYFRVWETCQSMVRAAIPSRLCERCCSAACVLRMWCQRNPMLGLLIVNDSHRNPTIVNRNPERSTIISSSGQA